MKIWLIQVKKNGVWQGWNNIIYYNEDEAKRLYKTHTENTQHGWMTSPGASMRLVMVELPVTVVAVHET